VGQCELVRLPVCLRAVLVFYLPLVPQTLACPRCVAEGLETLKL